MRVITGGELASGAAVGAALDERGVPREPLLGVDLDGRWDPVETAAAAREPGRILVGVTTQVPSAPLADALDLVLTSADTDVRCAVTVEDPVATLHELAAAVDRAPRAALILAGLLRMTEALPIPAALEAESLAYSTLLGGPEFADWLRRQSPRPVSPPPSDPVLVSRTENGTRLEITLNRPERRNAYGRAMRDALVDALRIAQVDDTVTGVRLSGAGPCFCAGGDLDEFGTTPDLATAHLLRTRAGAARPLAELADRVEVRVHGACVGAGVELPAFAGTVQARADTTFRLPELAMGLLPGAGGTVGIPRRIGRRRTLYLALTGTALDTATALRWGLVDSVDPLVGS